jgi:hypothetical protein
LEWRPRLAVPGLAKPRRDQGPVCGPDLLELFCDVGHVFWSFRLVLVVEPARSSLARRSSCAACAMQTVRPSSAGASQSQQTLGRSAAAGRWSGRPRHRLCIFDRSQRVTVCPVACLALGREVTVTGCPYESAISRR